MLIEALRNKTAREVRDDVAGFAPRYVEDRNRWINAQDEERIWLFGRILRGWQATHPLPMKRTKAGGRHSAPYLDDLLTNARTSVRHLAHLEITSISKRTTSQTTTLTHLWDIFRDLPLTGEATCVGVTKAILLATQGKVGLAFDSKVRKKLRIDRPSSAREWLIILDAIGEDIAIFESKQGPLSKVVPSQFATLAYGRLYDMALGPRWPTRRTVRRLADSLDDN